MSAKSLKFDSDKTLKKQSKVLPMSLKFCQMSHTLMAQAAYGKGVEFKVLAKSYLTELISRQL